MGDGEGRSRAMGREKGGEEREGKGETRDISPPFYETLLRPCVEPI